VSSIIHSAPIVRRALTSHLASVCHVGLRKLACVVLIAMSLLPGFTWLATLSALTGRRLIARAADVNRRTRHMVSNKLKPSAVKVTLKVLRFGPAAGLSLKSLDQCGAFCRRRLLVHPAIVQPQRPTAAQRLCPSRSASRGQDTSNCLDDQERRGRPSGRDGRLKILVTVNRPEGERCALNHFARR
jgi:hypothetical protein